MNISTDGLQKLYERLIRQSPYPGQTCPAEHVMVDHDSGSLPRGISDLVEEHISRCPSCRDELQEIRSAVAWFLEHERWILLGMAAKGAAGGILPWSKCPSTRVVYRYVNNEIRDVAGGKVLLAQMRDHMGRCPQCARLAEEFRAAAGGPRVSILDLGARVGYAIADRFRDFLDALVATSQAAGAPAYVRGAPGFRGAGEETASIDAPVVDPDGKVMVDDEGQPRQCRFDIIQANIQQDGFLTVDLSTMDRHYHQREEHSYEATCGLIAGGVRLDLPGTAIDEQGRVTFTGMLPEAKAVDPLPLSVLDLTVRQPSGPSGPGAAGQG